MRTLSIALILAIVLLTAFALATQYTYYEPLGRTYVIVQKSPNEQVVMNIMTVEPNSAFAWYCKPGYIGCVTPQWMTAPGVAASAWTPNGTPVEYVYKKAVAIFDIPENVTTDAIVWNEWILWGTRLRDFGARIYQNYINKSHIIYGMQVAIKLGNDPVLTCLKKVPWPIVDWGFSRWPAASQPPKELYYVVVPGDNATKVILASAVWQAFVNVIRFFRTNCAGFRPVWVGDS